MKYSTVLLDQYKFNKAFVLLDFDKSFDKTADFSISPEAVKSGITSFIADKFKDSKPLDILKSILQPAVLTWIFRAIGIGTGWGMLVTGVLEYFHVDLWEVVKSIGSSLLSLASKGVQPSEQEIDSIVKSNVTQHFPIEKEASTIEQFDHDCRAFKFELYNYKTAQLSFLSGGLVGKGVVTFLGYFFRVLIASIFGKALGNVFNPKVEEKESNVPTKPSFKNESYFGLQSRQKNIPANESDIKSYLLSIANELYYVSSLEKQILNNATFQFVVRSIITTSKKNESSTIVIPENFSDKKSLINFFMDEIL